MKTRGLQMHRNLAAPRSPTQESIPSKTDKNKSKKGSSQQSIKDKSSRGKSRKPHSPTEANPRKKSKVKSLRKSHSRSSSEESQRPKKKRNIYTGIEIEEGRHQNFVEGLNERSFMNPAAFKMGLLGYIFKKRLVRDQQYNQLYESMVQRFPQQEEVIKNTLFEIVSSLDS